MSFEEIIRFQFVACQPPFNDFKETRSIGLVQINVGENAR
jgi:hypothetical protein